MQPPDPLDNHHSLLQIRKRAARRYEIFFAILLLLTALPFAFYLRQTYNVESAMILFPLLMANFGFLAFLHACKESELSSMIELIEAMQESGRSAVSLDPEL